MDKSTELARKCIDAAREVMSAHGWYPGKADIVIAAMESALDNPEEEYMPKFTPGPWKFEDGYKFYHCTSTQKDKTGYYFEVGKNFDSPYTTFDEEWMANARLISAAPDMHEALKDIYQRSTDGSPRSNGIFSAIIAGIAKDALDKAEGVNQ